MAVVEWEGAQGKTGSASRIIPIAVYDGQNYQPGGLYLARPAPLALYSGTEYILESAGRHLGYYDVDSARDVQGYWIGYGQRKPLDQAQPSPEATQKKAPELDPGRPHYGNSTQTPSSQPQQQTPPSGQQTSQSGTSSQPSPRPTLERRQAPPPPSQEQAQRASTQSEPTPDRPVLRHRPSSAEGSDGSFLPAGPETNIASADSGRPHLSHGSKNPTNTDFKLAKLTGAPVDMHQMVAISDATDSKPRSLVFSWANPADAGKMQAALEKLAIGYLTKPASAHESRAHEPARAHSRSRRPVRRSAPAQPAVKLTNEQFRAYGLTLSGGATLVFSAQTDASPGKVRYITLIAHPDFYGVPQVLFKSITSDDSLDQTPRMKLIDAADTEGDGRGDLIFELISRNSRQFAIYQVAGGKADQLFTTGPLTID